MSPAEPYERLVRIIEQELEWAGNADYEALTRSTERKQELVQSLPATPPAEARAALTQATLLQRRLEMELERDREALVLKRGRLGRMLSYAPARREPSFSQSA